ncbi:MAG: threonine--tRNA ligase [Acidiferrobacteraceae bacterium]|jgi:threonyl-tRNA synthetase|nr:threonine--tRNA ligase [Acidiferrobacteraceae bacterium]MDP6552320.1 threonine--tRNA ligase [Arenicellales bacterium]MDP6790393.1 threonine--tRNA ligase [Arenicellales bacterium]MDP6919586.1 threonine--tRNA ligase [Arenicellales bacterium]|tara:strand:+ start:8941 stop:10848 length:1908 start_codon:yes stop_codon:yes gene_type:complete
MKITLPDASVREYPGPRTVAQIAADIGPGLAKATLGGDVDGALVDASHEIHSDAAVRIITAKDPEGLEILRHSCAHLLAQAVKQLYPEAQVTIGPVIEDGFYYDFAYAPGFTEDDLERIQERMQTLAKTGAQVERIAMSRAEAIAYFRDAGEGYKAEIIEEISAEEALSIYRQGDFTDLCRGPHVPNIGMIRAFKLTKLAGAYWRGDSSNEMLQRIYGTAWGDKKSLEEYLTRIAEAEKRDHRRIGKTLDLFHFQEEAPGMVFWHRDGWTLYTVMERYVRNLLSEYDYQEVHTPQMLDRSLWERSGHWDKFRDNMFIIHVDDRDYAIKPMNCPGHVQLFNQGLRSYRDLPIRIAEFGIVHRNEPSGTLHGLLRARRFTQDDAHVFCTEDQLHEEVSTLIELTYRMYRDFGFNDIEVALSTRPEQRVGEDALWDRAEDALARALEEKGIDYVVQPGEGAFYGPKHEFVLRDSIGRRWQCGTIQVDFSMPSRLGASYVTENGSKQVPVMIHRAILGSLERFIGILIEDTAGRLPFWLAPVQAIILNIADRQQPFALEIENFLKKHGLRVETDLRNEKIGYKIRESTLRRIPYLLVVGDREVEQGCVAVRTREGEDLGTIAVSDVVEQCLLPDASARH